MVIGHVDVTKQAGGGHVASRATLHCGFGDDAASFEVALGVGVWCASKLFAVAWAEVQSEFADAPLRVMGDDDAQVQPQLQSYSTNVGDIVGLTTTMIRDRESKWERAFSHLENEASFFCHQAAGRRLPTADNKKPILAADFLAALESELSEMFL
jgi:hypothetical protein